MHYGGNQRADLSWGSYSQPFKLDADGLLEHLAMKKKVAGESSAPFEVCLELVDPTISS